MSIRVAIADDHPVVRAGMLAFLRSQANLQVVLEASSLDVPTLIASNPEVAVLDVRMPGVCAGAIETLSAAGIAVLLFTRAPKGGPLPSLLAAGARGVVAKDAPLPEVLEAIDLAYRGELKAPAPELRPHEELSPRERAVFDALIRSQRPKEIAFELGLSQSTVYTYAERVRRKLGMSDVRDIMTYAHREGLLDRDSRT